MGVGLEAGLTIDAMAEELGDLIDRADAGSLPGDVDELADTLASLGERLLVMGAVSLRLMFAIAL